MQHFNNAPISFWSLHTALYGLVIPKTILSLASFDWSRCAEKHGPSICSDVMKAFWRAMQ